MKKTLFLLSVLTLLPQFADAKIFRNNYYYNRPNYYNGVYYNNPRNFYNYRYDNCPKRKYYNQRPVIYKKNIKRSMSNEKLVASQFSGLDKMERKIFSQTFEADVTKNRIERLEQKIFGAIQNGALDERFSTLQSAVANYKAYSPTVQQSVYNQYRPPVFTGSTGSSWKNTLWGNFKNQFAGMPTGFTPAMDPAYMDYFEAERALMGSGQNIDYETNHGYYRSNTNRGVQTGVTILD